MSELQAFLLATERCVTQAKVMLVLEQEKRQALLADDLSRLEGMIQAQQASIMKLESLEKQRVEAQDKAGYHNLKADEILELLDEGPEKETLQQHVGSLKQSMEEIRYHNDKALEIARANLQMFNTLAKGTEEPDKQAVYRPKQAYGTSFQSGSSFNKNI